METRIDFLRWLSTKLYLINIGLYATIGMITLLPAELNAHLAIPPAVTTFGIFFVVLFLRVAYESLVIYEAPIKSLSPRKMSILALIMSGMLFIIFVFLKPKFGYFSIPVALIISMFIAGKLKAALWPTMQRPGFFGELPAKLKLIPLGQYGFYGILVGITYPAYAKYGLNFIYTFAVAFFIGMMFEESYNFIKLYGQKITTKPLIAMIIWSITCAIAAAAIIAMMKYVGYSGPAATITSVVILKLIQPLGSRKFILGL